MRVLGLTLLLAQAVAFAPPTKTTTTKPPLTLGVKADDSWSAELRQAGGAFDETETSAWLSTITPKDATAREKNEALLAWLQKEDVWVSELSGWGIPPHSLALATDTFDENEGEASGRGLLARRPITQDTELIRMPTRLCLTKEKALERGLCAATDNEYVAVAKLLAHEKNAREESFWKTYLDVLPTVEDISPTFAWSDEDLDALRGSPCFAATKSMQKKLRDEHAAFAPDLDFEDWQWAFSILFSRAIRLSSNAQEFLALVPYVDFINHSPFSSSYVGLEDAPKKVMPWDPILDDEVVLYADRSYKKFEQIFISYGPKSNSDLLILYGFALDRNPFNAVNVVFAASEQDPMYAQKKQFLDEFSGGEEGEKAAFPLYADRFADEMLQYLRLLVLTEAQLQTAAKNQNVQPKLSELDFSTIISFDNEVQVLESIKAACEEALAKYPTDVNEVPAAFLSRNLRMATRLVATEKRILQQTIQASTRKQADLGPSSSSSSKPDVLSTEDLIGMFVPDKPKQRLP